MSLARVTMNDFRGGLNTLDGPFNLQPNEAQDLLNVTLTLRGALRQRLGKTRFDTGGFPEGAARADHLRSWYFGNNRLLMASIGGDVYQIAASGAAALVKDGTADTVWYMEQMQDVSNVDSLWLCNGVDAPTRITSSFASTSWTLPDGVNPKMARVWKNRMVVAMGHRLWFSDIANPLTWPTTNFQDVKASEDDLDDIQWLEILGDVLLVFKKRALWRVLGDVPNLQMQRVGEPGAEGRFMTAVSAGRAFYWSRSGLWSTDGTDAPRMETDKIENWLYDHVNFAAIDKVRVASTRDRRVFVAIPTESFLANSRLLEVLTGVDTGDDQERSPILLHDLPVASLAIYRSSVMDEVLAGDSSSSRVHKLFLGPNDDGVAITSRWKSAWQPIQAEEPVERLRRVNVLLSGAVMLNVYRDFFVVGGAASLSTTSDPDPLWEGGPWDGGKWDASSQAQLLTYRPETRGRYHAVEVTNRGLNSSFELYAIELVYRGGKEHKR